MGFVLPPSDLDTSLPLATIPPGSIFILQGSSLIFHRVIGHLLVPETDGLGTVFVEEETILMFTSNTYLVAAVLMLCLYYVSPAALG